MTEASVFTGSHEHIWGSSGRAFRVIAEQIIRGSASLSFHQPVSEYPETYLIRREKAFAPDRRALLTIYSPTSFDCP
jgi:hypothetical protein